MLLFVVVPSVLLGDALGTTAFRIAGEVQDGDVDLPEPPASVKDWPIVGESAYRTWYQASTNLDAFLDRSSDWLVDFGGRLLGTAGSAALAMVEFAGSIVLAGFLLARRRQTSMLARALFARVAPGTGDRLLRVSEQTVRSVAAGVLGVAIIQATLVGIGLLVADVPFAGVWALVCLLLGIMQLPMGLVVTPIMIYQFLNVPTTQAVVFAP